MPDQTRPTYATRSEEAAEARRPAGPDREPTAEEEAAAEANRLEPSVAEHESEMTERGAHQQGEGRIP